VENGPQNIYNEARKPRISVRMLGVPADIRGRKLVKKMSQALKIALVSRLGT
jgi:hypothetical protein